MMISKNLLMTVRSTFQNLVGDFLKSTLHLYCPPSFSFTPNNDRDAVGWDLQISLLEKGSFNISDCRIQIQNQWFWKEPRPRVSVFFFKNAFFRKHFGVKFIVILESGINDHKWPLPCKKQKQKNKCTLYSVELWDCCLHPPRPRWSPCLLETHCEDQNCREVYQTHPCTTELSKPDKYFKMYFVKLIWQIIKVSLSLMSYLIAWNTGCNIAWKVSHHPQHCLHSQNWNWKQKWTLVWITVDMIQYNNRDDILNFFRHYGDNIWIKSILSSFLNPVAWTVPDKAFTSTISVSTFI